MASIIIGMISLALGIWGLSVWWWSVAELLRGGLPAVLIIFGLIAFGAGISKRQIKDDVNENEGQG